MGGTRDKAKKAKTHEFSDRIGLRLQDKRIHSKNKMTQEEFGKKIGFCRAQVSNYERGEVPVTGEVLYRYWEAFDFSVDDLFKEINEIEKANG